MLKRKEYPRSREDKSLKPKKMKKQRKHTSSRHGDLKVRSVSELAELVTSGAVRVPKSLVEYVDDRVQLLDQVFTILSPTDIKGMLPDILKGLKMKRVKQLCYEQLKTMSSEHITDVIQTKGSAENTKASTPLTSVSQDLDSHSKSQITSPNAANTKCMSGSSTAYSILKLLDEESVSTSTNFSSMPHRDTTMSYDAMETPVSTGGVSSTSKLSPAPVDEFIISISDVSDVEDSLDRELTNCQQQIEVNQPSMQSTDQSIEEMDSGTSSGIEDEDEDLSDIPEAEQLLEMEFRRRALEAELKRITKTNSVGEPSTADCGSKAEQSQDCESDTNIVGAEDTGGTKVVQVDCNDAQEGGDGDIVENVIEVDFGTLLEIKLRQKALQSLLAKRRKFDLK